MWLRPCSRSDSCFGDCILLRPDRFSSDECVFPCVDSHLVIPPPQGGMDDATGFPEDALDEADSFEVTVASAACPECSGLKNWLRRHDLRFLFLVG